MDRGLKIELAGEPLQLTDRSLYWPRRRILFVADLHLGRTESMQRQGCPVPNGDTEATLERLASVTEQTQAKTLIILGDLFHRADGVTTRLLEQLRDVMTTRLDKSVLIEGNHDGPVVDARQELPVEIRTPPFELEPFTLTHRPMTEPTGYNLAGHLHPTVHLEGPAERLTLPCYRFDPGQGILPAFTLHANGVKQSPKPERRLFAVSESEVIPIRE
jgi:DNA ligase-associated metallophosphoesterase